MTSRSLRLQLRSRRALSASIIVLTAFVTLYAQGPSAPTGLSLNNGLPAVALIAAARQPGGTTTVPNPVWAGAGVEGGIPHRTNICASLAAGSSIASINTAISSCSSSGGGVVSLAAGTFSGGSIVMKSNVTLRGQGVSTIYNVTSTSTNFYYGQGRTALYFGGAFDSSGYGQNPAQGGAPSANKRTITGCNGVAGSYPQGCTVLNLNSAPNSALTVGSMMTIWQVNDADASVPKSGFQVSSKTGSGSSAISWQGSGESRTSAMQQRVRVTNINGSTVTVTPGLFLPDGTWRSDRTASAAWQGNELRMAGVEDMVIRGTSGPSDQWSLIQFWQAQNCWLARTVIQPRSTGFHAGGATQNVIQIYESRNVTIRDNWMDHAMGGGQGSTTSYGVSMNQSSNSLVENNIFNTVESPMMFNSGATGNVVAYNYEIIGSQQEGGIQNHEVGVSMNLVEGNTATKYMADVFHGNNNFTTVFRNYLTSSGAANIDPWALHGRFWNIIGNVLSGTLQYKSLVTDSTKRGRYQGVCIRLGYPSDGATAGPDQGVAADPEVGTTAMLWGNYCAANSSTNFVSSEVPSGISTYPNPVPSSQTLPASLFRSARPAYFTVSGTVVAWPPIGPDVTGGTSQGGRAHKLPAQRVFEAAGGNSSNFDTSLYGGTP